MSSKADCIDSIANQMSGPSRGRKIQATFPPMWLYLYIYIRNQHAIAECLSNSSPGVVSCI